MNRYLTRRTRLRHNLQLGKREALLVTQLMNVSYLTGFTGSSGWLIVTADREWLLSDSRYKTQLADECPGLECEIRDASVTQLQSLVNVVQSAKFTSLKYEADSLTKSAFDQLESNLDSAELVATSSEVENLRAIKDDHEIEAIRKSIRVNEAAFRAVRAQLRPDQTEREIGFLLENQMRNFGASGVAFDTSVAVGARSALPHGKPSSRKIGEADFVLIDWGTRLNRYMSDLTRILVTTKISPKLREIYNIVLAAQASAIAAVRPGVELKTVDAAARSVIETAGYGNYFGHGLGHSFGLEIHEPPFLSPIFAGTLAPGMVLTIEPGIYLPDWGGVRIEDDILVTQNGCEVLSTIPKDLDQCVVGFV